MKPMGWESFNVVRFDLGPLLQGQIREAKLKSTNNSLIVGPRVLGCETNFSAAFTQVMSECNLTMENCQDSIKVTVKQIKFLVSKGCQS